MLTIGLPFYNNESTLANAIKSVLIQTYTDWELILINDGSTDRSAEVAIHLAAADKRIKLINDDVNRGLIFRLNQIIDLAKGEYIARMDADDMMMPEKLQKQMAVLLNDNNIDVIDTAAYTIDHNDEPMGIRGLNDLKDWDRKKTFKKVLLFHPTVIAKASWYRQNKYDENFVRSEDFELWCRTFDKTVFSRVYEPLFLYKEGKINIKNYTTSNRTHRKMLRKYGPSVLSIPELYIELIKSHLKSTLYRIFSLVKMQHILVSKRNAKLSTNQILEVKSVIKKINSYTKQPVSLPM